MYAVFTTITVLYVLWYARRVKNDPARSMVPAAEGDQALASGPAGPPRDPSPRRKRLPCERRAARREQDSPPNCRQNHLPDG